MCACASAPSGSDGGFSNVCCACGTILLSVSSAYCVCVVLAEGGHTVVHVSLIRLSLAGPGCLHRAEAAAPQGHHSPATNAALLLPLSHSRSLRRG